MTRLSFVLNIDYRHMGRQNIFIVPSKFRGNPFLLMPKNRKQLRYFIYLCKGRPWKSGNLQTQSQVVADVGKKSGSYG